ncbi:MAG TPA: hypothetical protein VFK09_00940 [Gemmatimonadales bacterium]|nr:hypothetical protein [Gemmatimonadales bacterium]
MTHSAWKACAVVLCVAALVPPLAAQAPTPAPVAADTAALEFHGFRAGVPLDEIAARLRAADGTRLRCERAKADRRITECRGMVSDPALGGPVQLWLSAVDSVTSVLTLSAAVGPDQLDAWRSALERRYGRVGARVQGPQWMMQWVRRGRMLRLTWRVDGGGKVASVALVDGRVLDAWGRDRARRAAS